MTRAVQVDILPRIGGQATNNYVKHTGSSGIVLALFDHDDERSAESAMRRVADFGHAAECVFKVRPFGCTKRMREVGADPPAPTGFYLRGPDGGES